MPKKFEIAPWYIFILKNKGWKHSPWRQRPSKNNLFKKKEFKFYLNGEKKLPVKRKVREWKKWGGVEIIPPEKLNVIK